MEFPFSAKSIFPGNINVVDNHLNIRSLDKQSVNGNLVYARSVDTLPHSTNTERLIHDKKWQNLIHIINVMGEASRKAQNLQLPITTGERLRQKEDQRLYFILDPLENGAMCIVGILKVGRKKLFVVDSMGQLKDVDVLCIMDFYVHESRQRRGFGKKLFDVMLTTENISPVELAIDRPSNKFVSFLEKHYDLRDMIAQPNNFAVYPGFFSKRCSDFVPGANEKSDCFVLKAPTDGKANNQRHSYAGSDSKIDADMLFSRALKTASARPRSFNDVGRCLNWTEDMEKRGGEDTLSNGSTENVKRNVKVNGTSPLAPDPLMDFDKRRSFPHQQSTSWNLFGIPSPTYGN